MECKKRSRGDNSSENSPPAAPSNDADIATATPTDSDGQENRLAKRKKVVEDTDGETRRDPADGEDDVPVELPAASPAKQKKKRKKKSYEAPPALLALHDEPTAPVYSNKNRPTPDRNPEMKSGTAEFYDKMMVGKTHEPKTLPLVSNSTVEKKYLSYCEDYLYKGMHQGLCIDDYNDRGGKAGTRERSVAPKKKGVSAVSRANKNVRDWFDEQGVVIPWRMRSNDEKTFLRDMGLDPKNFPVDPPASGPSLPRINPPVPQVVPAPQQPGQLLPISLLPTPPPTFQQLGQLLPISLLPPPSPTFQHPGQLLPAAQLATVPHISAMAQDLNMYQLFEMYQLLGTEDPVNTVRLLDIAQDPYTYGMRQQDNRDLLRRQLPETQDQVIQRMCDLLSAGENLVSTSSVPDIHESVYAGSPGHNVEGNLDEVPEDESQFFCDLGDDAFREFLA